MTDDPRARLRSLGAEAIGDPASNGHAADPPAVLLPLQPAGLKPERPRPPVLVDGLLDQGDMTVLGAGRAVGKSWWGMGLGKMIAQGHGRFMGAFEVRQAARVLYCHGELDDWGAYDRWQKLGQGLPMPDNLSETFEPWRIRVSNRRIHRQHGPESITDEVLEAILDGRVEQTIIEREIQVLIIDPWAVYYSGRENSNDEAEAALRTLRDLQARYGLSVVILHHFGKNDQARDPEDLWRGASRLADWAHTRVTLQALYTPQQAQAQGLDRHQARRYATARFLRRRHIPPADIAIRWDVETGQWERFKSTLIDQAGDETAVAVTDMLQKIPEAGWPSVRKAAADLGIARGTAEKLLDRAVAQGFLNEYKADRGATGYRRHTPDSDTERLAKTTGQAPLANLPPGQSKTGGDQQ